MFKNFLKENSHSSEISDNKIKLFLKKTIISQIYTYIKKIFHKPKSQSNESQIINKLINEFNISNTFIEFGFSGWEFNCAELAIDKGTKVLRWSGLLVDGDNYNKKIGNIIFHKNIVIKSFWLSLDTLNCFFEFKKEKKNIGILSLDIDGNEFWILEKLIILRPDMIICEFNVALGLRTITVPYDKEFDRTKKHETWLYHGLSITALNYICNKNDYSLVAVSSNGVNAFFIRNDLLNPDSKILTPEKAFKTLTYADGTTSDQDFERIKHLPFVDVTKTGISHNSFGEIVT